MTKNKIFLRTVWFNTFSNYMNDVLLHGTSDPTTEKAINHIVNRINSVDTNIRLVYGSYRKDGCGFIAEPYGPYNKAFIRKLEIQEFNPTYCFVQFNHKILEPEVTYMLPLHKVSTNIDDILFDLFTEELELIDNSGQEEDINKNKSIFNIEAMKVKPLSVSDVWVKAKILAA